MATHAHSTPAPAAAPPAAIFDPNRRRLLSGLAGAAFAGTALTIAMPSDAAAEHPDAELLDALAEFDALELRMYPPGPGPSSIAAEEARDIRIAPLQERQHEALARICALPTRTLDGFRARARSFVLWDGGHAVAEEDDPEDDLEARMIGVLFRDLAGGLV